MQRRKFEEMLLIGMVHPSFMPTEERKKAAEVQKLRRELQEQYQADYEKVRKAENRCRPYILKENIIRRRSKKRKNSAER